MQTHYEMMLSASPPRPTTSPGYDVPLTTSGGHAADRLTLDDGGTASPPPAYTVLDVGPPPPPPLTQTAPSTPEHSRRPLVSSGINKPFSVSLFISGVFREFLRKRGIFPHSHRRKILGMLLRDVYYMANYKHDNYMSAVDSK